MEAMVQRLDQLAQDEGRLAVAQILEIVHDTLGMFLSRQLSDSISDWASGTMHQIASDLNKSKREPFFDVAIADWVHRDCPAGDDLQQDIIKWLSPPDQWDTHYSTCKLRHPGSAEWFIQGNTFSEWKSSDDPVSLLWVRGNRAFMPSSFALVEAEILGFKAGAGKSVLWYVELLMFLSRELIVQTSSTIIQHIDDMQKNGQASLAFFYFNFREDQKGLRGLLSSFLVQLCCQSDSYCDFLSEFRSNHARGLLPPNEDALMGCLKKLLEFPGKVPVYLIMDALDECPDSSAFSSPRADVLRFIRELFKPPISNLRICVTSRPKTDIHDILRRLIFRTVSLHDKSEQRRDIEKYIRSVIDTHRESKKWKTENKQLVTKVLAEKSGGM
jgi:NACHT domain-containing protein